MLHKPDGVTSEQTSGVEVWTQHYADALLPQRYGSDGNLGPLYHVQRCGFCFRVLVDTSIGLAGSLHQAGLPCSFPEGPVFELAGVLVARRPAEPAQVVGCARN